MELRSVTNTKGEIQSFNLNEVKTIYYKSHVSVERGRKMKIEIDFEIWNVNFW